jgi:glycosyltransferase involved in cell wall biosynthesis
VTLRHQPRVLAARAVTLFIRSAWIADRIEHAGGCRLVHGHFALAQTEVAMGAAGLLGCPFSFTAHARDIYATPSALEEKVRAATLVVSCTASNVGYLRALCPDAADRIHLAYLGVYEGVPEDSTGPPAVASSGRPPAPGPLILAAGRLVPKKGFDTLVDACAQLKDRGVRFQCRLHGDGPDRDRLQRQMDQTGVGDRMTLAGWTAPTDLASEMNRATVFAVPSRVSPQGDRDGLPNVVLEAMARGVPVVATSVSGIPEAIADGESGLLVEPDNPTRLADALQRLLEDPAARVRLGQAALERVRRDFTIDAASGRLAALFGHGPRSEGIQPRP